jgi:hypothetical protein
MPVYRTARGNAVDMSTLTAKNEKTRAVGNMNVNARGDVIDNHNRIITDNTKRVKAGYQKLVTSPTKTSPQPKTSAANVPDRKPTVPEIEEVQELTLEEKELFDNDEDFEK